MNDYLAAILFFLPAGVSNMSPLFANKIPWLNRWTTPMDFGQKWNGRRILGDNKRVRGIVFGTIMGGLTALVVSRLNANTIVTLSPFLAGSLMGFGALFGDAVESFFKRAKNIKPGDRWFPFDQIDYIIGGLAFIYPFVQIPLWAIVTILIVYFGLHLLFSYIGYKLGLKTQPI